LENRPQQALDEFRHTRQQDFSLIGQTEAQFALGHRDEARQILKSMIDDKTASNWWGIADIYAQRGDADQAFAWADRAYAHRDSGMTWIEIDTDFRSLRGDPRFKALLRKMNLPE
jgi:hypothetical protein